MTPPRSNKSFSLSLHRLGKEAENPLEEEALSALRSSLEIFFRLHFDELYPLVGEADFSLYLEDAIEKTERQFIKENRHAVDKYCRKQEQANLSDGAEAKEVYPFLHLSFPFLLFVSKGERGILVRAIPKSSDATGAELDNRVTSLTEYLNYLTKDQLLDALLHGIDPKSLLIHNLPVLEKKGVTP
ncbi:MAG: hypothetical protein PUA93_01265 [Eubacteriales bacterium]|nr:hypothetical protein [Eubacteriales bacterium]